MEKQEIRIDEKTFQLNNWPVTEEQVQLVNASWLGALSIIRPGRIDHPLVAANAERWHSETNSFHYNIQIGEMTPAIFDVYKILGLFVDGEPVTCRPINDLRKFIEDNLGIIPIEVATVPTRYLQFEDIEQANRYAWGAVALAYLYCSLGKAYTFKRRHFSGFATLMQVIWNPYFKSDEAISDDRHEAFEAAMCVIFDDIIEPYMSDRVCRQFGAKQGIPRNHFSVGKRSSKYGEQRDWRNVNSNKIHHWLSCYDHMMTNIEVNTVNGLASQEYKAWYNRVSHPIIHNVANPPIDILQHHNQEEEEVVPAHESQYIIRPRGYEDDLVSAVQASTTILSEALTLRQKWYPKVYSHVNAFEMLSKFVPANMEDMEAMMELLQREVNEEAIQEVVGKSS
ncbi:hypothetical protein AMTR_s00156p00021000 [Amborella trichopoda]|uniref:Aminotransferase-like plant mobile domain-containing protein n=1 Tax=Amborella trichopoda TaxID=13333 RepID=W1PKL5_AMBTC|nr:hypothetical protein AMTR_s00156p00021000 [Amborella trichopoda]